MKAQTKIVLANMVENYKGLAVSTPSYVDEYRKSAANTLQSVGAEVVVNELVYDAQTAKDFVLRASKTPFDAIVLNVIGWPGGDSVLIIGKAYENLPLMLWTAPNLRMALCGYFEVTSDLKSIGRRFIQVLGNSENQGKEVASFLRAVATAKRLNGMRIAQLGCTPPDFVDATAHEIELTNKMGLEIIRLDLSELFSEIQTISTAESEESLSQMPYVFKVNNEDLIKSAKTSIALQRIFAKYRLDAGALRCLPELQRYSFPCMGVSRLNSGKISVACEGDLPAAITLTILQELTGSASTMFDLDSVNADKNLVNLWHCGQAPATLAANEKEIMAIPPTYLGQVCGPGVILSFSIVPSKVTLAKLDRKGEKMLIASGRTVSPDGAPEGAYAEVKLDTDVTDFVRRIAVEGMEHHICLVLGDVSSELENLCAILNIESIRLSNSERAVKST